MTLLEKINEQIISDYKSGEGERRVFLQTIKSVLLTKKIELKRDLNEQEEIQTLKSELKKIEEAGQQYKSGGRDDLSSKADFEAKILKDMLPEEMSEADVENIVKGVIDKLKDKSFGSAMKAAMAELKGKADGGVVSRIVKSVLEN